MNRGFFTQIAIWIAGGLTALASLLSPHALLGANQKLSELTSYSKPSSSDIIPINDTANATTKQITVGNLFSSATSTNFTTSNLLAFGSSTLSKLRVNGSATTTDFYTTTLLAQGSSTLQLLTAGSTTVQTNFLTNNATTTNLFVSNIASTSDFRANTENVGASTIGNLTVSACTGCSAAGSVTIYYATTTTTTYKAKTLNLIAGDAVVWTVAAQSGTNAGSSAFRISSPWAGSSTTVMSDASSADDPHAFTWSFLATTTETVTFDYNPGSVVNNSMTIWKQSGTNGQQF